MPEYILAKTNEEYAAAAELFKEYANWLDIDLCFQNFDKELVELRQMYSPSAGGIILCKENNEFIGCVGVRRIDTDTAELKRMYLRPEHQKRGIGMMLLERSLALAKNRSYVTIRLDTLNNMLPAINLYKKNGFYEIPAYYHNPEPTAVYFEKKL